MTEIKDLVFDLPDNHVPDWMFDLCHDHNVFYRDHQTGELVQVLDLRGYFEMEA